MSYEMRSMRCIDGSVIYAPVPVRSPPPMPPPLVRYLDYDKEAAILKAHHQKWTLAAARKKKRLRRELGARRYKQKHAREV